MRLTRLHQVGARTEDLDTTRRFYEDVLGAHCVARFDPPGLLFFEFAGTRVLFERNNPPAILYFLVDDIDAAHADLVARGVTFDHPPGFVHRDEDGLFGDPGLEEWMAFFKDPGGNTVALATRR